MNDNQPKTEQLIGRVLADTIVADHMLTTGMDTLLTSHGVPGTVRSATREYVQPLLDQLAETEKLLVGHARDAQMTDKLKDAMEGLYSHLINRVELFAGELERLATTPDQLRLSATFTAWVKELGESWRGPSGPVIERGGRGR